MTKTPISQLLARVSLLAVHEHLREKRRYLAGVQAIKSRFFPIYLPEIPIHSLLFLYYAGSPKVPPPEGQKPCGGNYFYPDLLAHENLNNAHKNVPKSYKIFQLAYTLPLAQGQILQKCGFSCTLWDVQGSGGIVVEYSAPISFAAEDLRQAG